MVAIFWIKGENTSGKTLTIKQMLGYRWVCNTPNLKAIKDGVVSGNKVLDIINYIRNYGVADEVKPIYVEVKVNGGYIKIYPKCKCTQCKRLIRKIKNIESRLKRYHKILNYLPIKIDEITKIINHHKWYLEEAERLEKQLEEINLARNRWLISPLGRKWSERLDKVFLDYEKLNESVRKIRWEEFFDWEEKMGLSENELYNEYQKTVGVNTSELAIRIEKLKSHRWGLYEAKRQYELLKKQQRKIKRKVDEIVNKLKMILTSCHKVDVWLDSFHNAVSLWYGLEFARKFKVDRLFISHSGPDYWFKNLVNCKYYDHKTKQWIHSIDVFNFPANQVYIEVPDDKFNEVVIIAE